jgi:hypothetical protein
MAHHTSRRNFLKSVCQGATALTFSGCAGVARRSLAETSAGKPNIVLMFVDNIGYGDLGCYGNKVVKTPRIDRFAREGVRCTDFYIGSPSCMPSRGGAADRQAWRSQRSERTTLEDRRTQTDRSAALREDPASLSR